MFFVFESRGSATSDIDETSGPSQPLGTLEHIRHQKLHNLLVSPKATAFGNTTPSLQVQDHASMKFPIVHILEDLREILQLVGGEVRFDDPPRREVKSLDRLLAIAHRNTNNLLGVCDERLGEGFGYRHHVSLWNSHADKSTPESKKRHGPTGRI